MPDPFRRAYASEASAVSGFAITPHATDPLSIFPRAVYVGGAGDLVVRLMNDNADVTFSAVPAGTLIPIRPSHVRSSSTATLLLGLY